MNVYVSIINTCERTLALALDRPPPAQNLLLCRSVVPVRPCTIDEMLMCSAPPECLDLAALPIQESAGA